VQEKGLLKTVSSTCSSVIWRGACTQIAIALDHHAQQKIWKGKYFPFQFVAAGNSVVFRRSTRQNA
jgi:hypothetical protein